MSALLGLAPLLCGRELPAQRLEGVARGLIGVVVMVAVGDEIGPGDGQLDAYTKGTAVSLMVRRCRDDDAQRVNPMIQSLQMLGFEVDELRQGGGWVKTAVADLDRLHDS